MGCRWKRIARWPRLVADRRRSGYGRALLAVHVLVTVIASLFVLSTVYVPSAAAQMGGAFPQFSWGGRFHASLLEGAPANDGFASVYNPAALRACRARQISVHQIRPFDVPITGIAWCAGTQSGGDGSFVPGEDTSEDRLLLGGHAIIRQSPPGLGFDYNTYQLGVALATRHVVGNHAITLGATPKLLIVSIDGTGTSLDEAAAGFALDAGVAYERAVHIGRNGVIVLERVAVDVSVVDALSRVYYGSGAVEPGATPVQRLSVTVAGPRLIIGVSGRSQDGRMTLGAGAEYVLFRASLNGGDVLRQIAIRGGVNEDGPSVGLGITLRGFAADYAYRMEGDGSTHVFSTGWYF